MKERIVIITENNLVKYPPMQSLLQILIEFGKKVCFVGYCSDAETQKRFEYLGVSFCKLYCEYGRNIASRLINNILYRRRLQDILHDLRVTSNDLIIYDYTDAIYYTHDLISSHRFIVLFYEFINPHRSWKYKLLYSSYNIKTLLQNSVGVIHCEYNRAQITKGLYDLKKLPYVLPNKPYIDDSLLIQDIPDSISCMVTEFKHKIVGKKVILYQGVFLSNERRLEEFCQAIELLPEDFILVSMGSGSDYYDYLKDKYESERIIFLPFINPPYHLLITQLASIGVLSYFPLDRTFSGVINPLYCAPNKIFEYSKYSIPMVSNDIPGLRNIFDKYQCGKVISDPFSPNQIKDAILDLTNQYQNYANGALEYYNSVDIKSIIKNIFTDIESNLL